MGNFSDYIKNNNGNKNIKQNTNKKLDEQDLEKLIDKYSDMNSDALLQEFMRMTIEKKRRGELTNSELENIKKTMLPYLNENQKNSLAKMMEIIKNV